MSSLAIKSVRSIELLNKVSSFLFNKTGTITYGHSVITGHNLDDHSLKLAAIAAKNSNCPIGKAIYEKFSNKTSQSPSDFREIEGGGFAAVYENNTIVIGNKDLIHSCEIVNPYFRDDVIYVAINKQIRGYICFSDCEKPNANELIDVLKKRKKQVAICSSDNRTSTEEIGKKVGVKSLFAALNEQDKVSLAQEVMKNKKLCVVGSKVIDSPVLSVADISISARADNKNVSQYADIVLLNENIGLIPAAIKLSSNYNKMVFRGVVVTSIISIAMCILAVCGVCSPILYLIGLGIMTIFSFINTLIK